MKKEKLGKREFVQTLLTSGLMALVLVAMSVNSASALKGDINDDGSLGLADAIIGMRVLTNQSPSGVSTAGDVDGDNKIGNADVVYVLVKLVAPAQTYSKIQEDFNDVQITPNDWTVVNNVGSVGWSFDNPGERSNKTGGSGNFAVADSDKAGEVKMDTELRTPIMDFSAAASVNLTFKTHYEPYGGSKADVDVSTDAGGSWTTVWGQSTESVNATVGLDLSAHLAEQSQAMVRFHYYDANWSFYWEIDDVTMEGVSVVTAAPGNLTATAQGTNITLRWTDQSDNETSFEIERSASSGSGFAQIGTVSSNQTGYTDESGLSCDTTYYYQVTASNTGGNSDASNTANAKTDACSEQVTTLNESFGSSSKPNDWDAGDGWVFNNPNDREAYTSDNFAIADPGNIVGRSVDSELRTPLLNLSDFSSVSLNFTTMYWHGTGSAEVDVSTDGGNTWTNGWRQTSSIYYDPIKSQTVDLSTQIAGKSNVMIRFHADVTNTTTIALWGIDDVKLETLSAPAAPSGLSATLGANSVVNLAWTGDGTSDIEVERSSDGGTNYTKVADVTGGASTYTDSSVQSGTTYYYRVRAGNTAATSAYSSSVSITTEDRSSVAYDITISYYDTPTNTSAKKTAIEEVIRYFADGVYESSNGANKIGRVTIYTNSEGSNIADIVWINDSECWPNAYLSGYAEETGPYKRIEMCDSFSGVDFLANETGYKSGGYTIAHEWGHYFYSLYDEYQGSSSSDDIGTPSSGDTAVQNSIMNAQWEAVNGDLNWLNFSAADTNTGNNSQYRVYGASAWETLIRTVSEDPRDGQRDNMPERIYHSELADAASSSGLNPPIEVESDAGREAAQSELSIVWADLGSGKRYDVIPSSGVAKMLVVDTSSGISQDQLDKIKKRMKGMADQVQIGDAIGIIAFDSVPEISYPLTVIQSETEKTTIKSAIDDMQAGTSSADVGAALQMALDTLTTEVPENINRVVYLVTAGKHSIGGDHPFSVIPAYEKNFVQLYTFGFAADDEAEEILTEMADQTGGEYHFVGSEDDLHKALDNAEQDSNPLVLVNINTGWYIADAGVEYSIPFYVDATLGEFGVYMSYFSEMEDAASVALIDPEGNVHDIPADAFESYANEWREETLFYSVSEPATGEWKIRVTVNHDLFYVYHRIDAAMEEGKLTYTAAVKSMTGRTVTYPDPILLSASVGRELTITDINVRGDIEQPDGTIRRFEMADDGVAPDHKAEDGIYAYMFEPEEDGDYHITVFFDNRGDTAQYSNYAVHYAPDENGNVPDLELREVGENFERFAEIQISVSGTLTDDHSDWYEDNPTELHLNNMPISGKIDSYDDRDTFRITVPDDYRDREIMIRVDNLGMGMDPFLEIFDEALSWEHSKYLDTEPTSDDSLMFPVFVRPGETFYVEVLHMSGDAETGLYNISAGPPLKDEIRPDEIKPGQPPQPKP